MLRTSKGLKFFLHRFFYKAKQEDKSQQKNCRQALLGHSISSLKG